MSAKCSIRFIPDNCIQCHGCEVACKNWRNVELGIKWRRVDTIWRGYYPKIKSDFTSIACMHCADPSCIKVCPVGAIEKEPSEGIVLVKQEKCVGCRACLAACPYAVPQFGADGKMQKCDLCFGKINDYLCVPPCVGTCPTKALRFVVGKQ